MEPLEFSDEVLSLVAEVSVQNPSLFFCTLLKDGVFFVGGEGSSMAEALENARVGASVLLDAHPSPQPEAAPTKPARKGRGK